MDHIKIAHNVLDPGMLKEMHSLLAYNEGEIIGKLPAYNFHPKNEPARNLPERMIRTLIGHKHHVEYWFRNMLDETLFHVDANELRAKQEQQKYGMEDMDRPKEFPMNTHVLYISIDPQMEGGELVILPYTTYIKGRPILDNKFTPLEGTRTIHIKPKENMLVYWDKPIYHGTNKATKGRYRVSMMFSEWAYQPDTYVKHHHWMSSDAKDGEWIWK